MNVFQLNLCVALELRLNLAIKLAMILLKMAPANWNYFSFQIFCFFELSLPLLFSPSVRLFGLCRPFFLVLLQSPRFFITTHIWKLSVMSSFRINIFFFTRLCSSLFWFNIFMKFRQFSILHKLFCIEADNSCSVFIIVAILIWRIYNTLITHLKQIITAPLNAVTVVVIAQIVPTNQTLCIRNSYQ